jgi:arylsulfatase A-like enzyme
MDGPAKGLNNSRLCSQKNQLPSCKYEDELFAEHMVDRITQHNTSTPFFGFVSWHNCHWPPEVPSAFLANFTSFIPVPGRAMYAAKANYMDAQIGKVVAALKSRGMFENTLIIGAADNGGKFRREPPLRTKNPAPKKQTRTLHPQGRSVPPTIGHAAGESLAIVSLDADHPAHKKIHAP